jgi:HD-GYP domain-containing protein (c-di-GMP phosphodiesterase class II)
MIDTHASKGAQILAQVGEVLKDLIPIVEAHHRHFHKSANPDHRAEAKIPIGARIIAVADAFDAMTTDRPYRRAMPFAEALLEISVHSGRQFDPAVVRAFQRVMENQIGPLPAPAPALSTRMPAYFPMRAPAHP